MVINFSEILIRISIIYILIFTGSFLRTLLKDPDNSSFIKFLTKIILNICFPFLIISSILNVSVNSLTVVFLSVSFGLVIIFTGISAVFLYSRFRSIPDQTLGSMFLAISFPNSVFLPFPLILILIGPQGLLSATLFAVTIIIVQNSLGSYLAIKYGSKDHLTSSQSYSHYLKKIVFFPPTFSMFIGFFLKILFQPSSFANFFSFLPLSTSQVDSGTNVVSWLSLIFALLLVGLTFKLSIHSLHNRFLGSASLFRLIVSPFTGIIFLILTFTLILPSTKADLIYILPLLIQAFSGPAVINIAFAKEFSLDVKSESIYITILTLLSLFILPFLIIFVFLVF